MSGSMASVSCLGILDTCLVGARSMRGRTQSRRGSGSTVWPLPTLAVTKNVAARQKILFRMLLNGLAPRHSAKPSHASLHPPLRGAVIAATTVALLLSCFSVLQLRRRGDSHSSRHSSHSHVHQHGQHNDSRRQRRQSHGFVFFLKYDTLGR